MLHSMRRHTSDYPCSPITENYGHQFLWFMVLKAPHPLTPKTHICRLVLLKPFISLGCEDLKHLKYEKNLFKCDYLIDYDYAL